MFSRGSADIIVKSPGGRPILLVEVKARTSYKKELATAVRALHVPAKDKSIWFLLVTFGPGYLWTPGADRLFEFEWKPSILPGTARSKRVFGKPHIQLPHLLYDGIKGRKSRLQGSGKRARQLWVIFGDPHELAESERILDHDARDAHLVALLELLA